MNGMSPVILNTEMLLFLKVAIKAIFNSDMTALNNGKANLTAEQTEVAKENYVKNIETINNAIDEMIEVGKTAAKSIPDPKEAYKYDFECWFTDAEIQYVTNALIYIQKNKEALKKFPGSEVLDVLPDLIARFKSGATISSASVKDIYNKINEVINSTDKDESITFDIPSGFYQQYGVGKA